MACNLDENINRTTAAGAGRWTVHIGVKTSSVTACPNTAPGDLCVIDSIAFTTNAGTPGCGDGLPQPGEQCDTGSPSFGFMTDLCSNVVPGTFLGYTYCNDSCGLDAHECWLPPFT